MRRPIRPTRGFTYVELLASISILTILLGGMTSAVVLASRALPDADDMVDRAAEATALAEQIASDLSLATTLILTDPDTVRFTVPDRGHGDAGEESMRYAWSGTPGDPLEYRYNGGAPITLTDDVQEFALEYTTVSLPLQGAPRVLLVVGDAGSPAARDEEVQATLESWGFPVQMVSDETSDGDFSTACADNDVIYICETVNSGNIATRLRAAPIGVLNEESYLCDDFGFSASSFAAYDTDVAITDNSHDITAGFALGGLRICRSDQILYGTDGPLGPGARELADFWGDSGLLVIDVGGALYGGGNAAARRVKLPWGGYSGADFSVSELNEDGLKLLQRSIVWAAAPIGVGSVTITLQLGADTDARVQRRVQLLNTPEVP